MTIIKTRRGFLAASGALALAGCASFQDPSTRRADIDRRVDTAIDFLRNEVPGGGELIDRSVGMLIMPLMTEAAFSVGGSYGEGALRINGTSVSYHSAAQASFGLQVGAQQFAQALFFMTPEALESFRRDFKFSVGGEAKMTAIDAAQGINAQTLTALDPVVGLVFGQAGIIAGATLEGTVYTRLNI